MSIFKAISICTISSVLWGCASLGFSDDFSVSGETTQTVEVDEDVSVTIRCFCENRKITRTSSEGFIVLIIRGTHGSVGYHGEQHKPESISPNLLEFVEKRSNANLVLESREYTYTHHAYIVDELEIIAPTDATIIVSPVSQNELEGRTVD